MREYKKTSDVMDVIAKCESRLMQCGLTPEIMYGMIDELSSFYVDEDVPNKKPTRKWRRRNNTIICSWCGKGVYRPWTEKTFDYCPWCGSPMDGEENEWNE